MYLSILFIYIYSVSFIYPKLVDKDMLLGTTVTFANLRWIVLAHNKVGPNSYK